MQIVELGEAIRAYDIMNIMEWCPLKSVSCKIAGPMTICVKGCQGQFSGRLLFVPAILVSLG